MNSNVQHYSMPPRPAKRGLDSGRSLRCRSLQMPLAAIVARCRCRSRGLCRPDAVGSACSSPSSPHSPWPSTRVGARPLTAGWGCTHSTTSQHHITAPCHSAPCHSTISQHHITAPHHSNTIIAPNHSTITAPCHGTTSQHHHSTMSQHDHSTISQHLSLPASPPPPALTASSSSSHLTLLAPLALAACSSCSHCLLLGGTVCGVREGCGRWWSV
jgi:hypothetical protein